MLINYNYHIWFRVCRMPRIKHKLSTNCLLVLNGCYCLSMVNNKAFTVTDLLRFVNYYNHNKVKVYITVLISRKFLDVSYTKGMYSYYSITQAGVNVIDDINLSYTVITIHTFSIRNI